jgi:hypothetical protein
VEPSHTSAQRYQAILLGLVSCSLIGGLTGICVGMLYRQDPNERATVHLEDCLPLFGGGLAFGYLAGTCVFAVCLRWPGCAPSMAVLVMTLLGTALAAPLGWIVGEFGKERQSCKGMAIAAAIGAVVGLTSGLFQFLIYRTRHHSCDHSNP